MPAYTEAEDAIIRESLAAGVPVVEIARRMGRTEDALRGRAKRLQALAPTAPVPAEEKRAFSEASLRAEVERLTRRVQEMESAQRPKRVAVESVAEPPVSAQELWERAEQEGERRIKHAHERSEFRVSFDAKPTAICFVSDQHIAPGTPCDFRRMREDAELIAATDGLYACLGGDGVDNHIKHRAAVLAARTQPHEQWELFEHYLSIFAEKIVALVSGNHESWTDQMAGVDMLALVAEKQRLCYAPHEARVEVNVGEQPYRIAFRHQYRFNSSFNQGHTVKQWWRMGPDSFDIGTICHHHEPMVEAFEAHGKTRWACRPGSYQLTSGYSRQYGFTFARPTCPTFVLFPGERRIVGFRDLRDAVKTLAAERAV